MDTLILNRYRLIERLGSGGMGEVYRAEDRLTGQPCAVKRVVLRDAADASRSTRSTSATALDPAAQLSVGLGRRLALAHEFRSLGTLRHPQIISVYDYGFDQDQHPFLVMELLDQPRTILEAGRGRPLSEQIGLLLQLLLALDYLHRRGVVHHDLKPENVLVLDGDRVKLLDFGLAVAQGARSAAGTLLYMAPEVLLGDPVTTRADLYAVGVMAYQMITGQHPFGDQDIGGLLEALMTRVVDPAPLHEIDPALPPVILRLLARQPEDRYPDVRAAVAAFAPLRGVTIPAETVHTRDSALQAARFTGRAAEVTLLRSALSDAHEGRGGVWLIGGESGVGKSRLLDEFRVLALVSGAQVLRGGALEDAGAPYQIWRAALRPLALLPTLSEPDLRVFKALVPDLPAIVGRPIDDAPELDPNPRHARIAATVERLLAHTPNAVVILLEDLHWCGAESLALLKSLAARAADMRWLIVGTYRSDEAPTLPDQIPSAQTLHLQRFTADETADLTDSMLGISDPRLSARLMAESEGNPFFLVEILRALAEDVPRLDQISAEHLPEGILSGGIQALVQRRLNRAPASVRPLLEAAAVAGRELDLALLRHLAPDLLGSESLDTWLQHGADAAILDVREGRWQFTHAKVRESLIAALPAERRAAVHRQIALALEALGSTDTLALTTHWHHAGDPERCARYAVDSGEALLGVSDARTAQIVLRRAYDGLPADADPDLRMRLGMGLGETCWKLSDFAAAVEFYTPALVLADALHDPRAASQILNGMAFVHWYRGDVPNAQQFAERALERARDAGDLRTQIRATNMLGSIAEQASQFDLADERFQEALRLACECEDQRLMASSLNNLGTLSDTRGDYLLAQAYYERALELCRVIGFRQGMAVCLNNLGVASERLNDLTTALRSYEQTYQLAAEIGDRLNIANARANACFVYFRQGDLAAAVRSLREGLTLAHSIGAGHLLPYLIVAAARWYWQRGDYAHAASLAGLVQHLYANDVDLMQIRLGPLMDEIRTSGDPAVADALTSAPALDWNTQVAAVLADLARV